MSTVSEANKILESLGGFTEDLPAESPSNHYSPGVTSSIEEKALDLLGAGTPAEQVASALGVVPSRISQLMADEEFAARVVQKRYTSLKKHNDRDSNYDSLEDKLIQKLEKSLPFMMKPETILRAISVINGATRRGQSAPDQVVNQQTIVNLTLPEVITQRFTTNVNNQVIKTGDQDLLTIQSGTLLDRVKEKEAARILENTQQTETNNDTAEDQSGD